MVRGAADFGLYAPKEVAASISDMGEVAARLGSIVTYDKRGDVVEFDNFEAPLLRWRTVASTDDDYVKLDSYSTRSLAQAVKLYVAGVVGHLAGLRKITTLPGTKQLGEEFSFSMLPADLYLYLLFQYGNANGTLAAFLWIDPALNRLLIEDHTDGYVEIDTFPEILTGQFAFHTAKLVVDFETKKYKRLLFDLKEYDISTYDVPYAAAPVAPTLERKITIENITGVAGQVWIDDEILTQAEP